MYVHMYCNISEFSFAKCALLPCLQKKIVKTLFQIMHNYTKHIENHEPSAKIQQHCTKQYILLSLNIHTYINLLQIA